jgi:hypothetical protein
MKANILQKSLIVVGMTSGLASMSSHAADAALSFSFETIVDVSIAQFQGLDFGADLAIAANTTCTLLVGTTDRPGSIVARQGLATAIAAASTFETRTGDCDNTGTGTAGIYAITGAPGVDVTVTVNPIVPAGGIDFSFVPAGVAVNYVAATADDTLLAVVSATPLDVQLANTDDVSTTGSPIPGQTYVYVGGTLTAQQALDAGSTYNAQTFVIDVVY